MTRGRFRSVAVKVIDWIFQLRSLIQVAPPARSVGAYAVIAAGTLGVLSGADFVHGGLELGFASIAWAIGMGVGAGALLGVFIGVVFNVLYRLPRFVPWVLWFLVAFAAAYWLIDTLGVVGQFSGPERKLARIALALALGAGGAVWLSILAIQPFRRTPRGWLGSRRWWWRLPVCLILLAGFMACTYADREFMLGTYPSAHLMLRAVAVMAVIGFLLASVPRLRHRRLEPRSRWVILGAVTLSALLPILTLTSHAGAELHALLSQPYSRLPLKLLRALGDPDWDGESAILGGGDCSSFNAKVHPRAQEIPGNGLDDNCVYGDAVDKLAQYEQAEIPTNPSMLSVVLISIDTLRADHTTPYGYSRDTTPGLARWAENAVVFERAYTSGGWTSLALPTLFRGVYPRRLRWTRLYETTSFRLLRGPIDPKLEPGEKWRRTYAMPLEEPRKPLAWWLRRRGMRTVAVVDDGFSQFLAPEMGMKEGFDEYVLADDFQAKQRDDRGVANRAIDELRAMPKDRPFFLWLHFFGPHQPSKNNPSTKRFGEAVADKYDHEIAFLDAQVSRVLDTIVRLQKQRRIATIVTSDHGEVLRERSRNHGVDLLDASVHIPLLIQAPGVRPSRTQVLASLVDLTPTILEWTETPAPGGMDGQSLVPVLAGDMPAPRAIVAELWKFNAKGEVSGEQIAAMDGKYKLTHHLDDESKTLVLPGKAEKSNLLGRVDAPHLEERLGRYLEENSRVQVFE